MTNKYLEKVADIVIKRRVDDGLPESVFNLQDAHANRLASSEDRYLGQDKRSPYLQSKLWTGAAVGGVGSALLAAASMRNPGLAPLGALLGGGAIGMMAGAAYGSNSAKGKRLYQEGYDASASRPLEERVGGYTDRVIEGFNEMYPSSGDFGDDDHIGVPIDTKGSILYIRPSVIEELREEELRDQELRVAQNTAMTGAHMYDASRSTNGGFNAGLAAAHGSAAIAGAARLVRRSNEDNNNRYVRQIANSFRDEMQYR